MTLADQTVPTTQEPARVHQKELGLRSFIGVGWSMGTFVWWVRVLQFGIADLRGLVIIDQPPSDLRSAQPEWPAHGRYRFTTGTIGCRRAATTSCAKSSNDVRATPSAEDQAWMLDEMTRAPAVIWQPR
jgi:pimeloyl-ACP methyl ester carboxylesterase